MVKKKLEFRDVSIGLQMLRSFLLGRGYKLHNRFTPLIAPRSVPPPDIPRATPDYKYSKQWYLARNAYDSVKPPVVAPVAEGPAVGSDPYKQTTAGGMKADSVCFTIAPTPGPTWWWDGHCYYEPAPEHGRPSPPCDSPCCPPTPSCIADACPSSSPANERSPQTPVTSPLEIKP